MTSNAALARRWRIVALVATLAVVIAIVIAVWPRDDSSHEVQAVSTTTATTAPTTTTSTGTAATPTNIYGDVRPENISPTRRGDPPRVYVPNGRSGTVSVIDPATRTVIATFETDGEPQHIVPSYDLSTLWVLLNQGNALVPIDPATGTPGTPVPVEDPYNLYFTPDGAHAIVVAERFRRLDFRDPRTMELDESLLVEGCRGINHADYNADGAYMIATCEFAGRLAKIDIENRRVVGLLDLAESNVEGQPHPMPMAMPDGSTSSSMPQDVRTAPDGRTFYVADMMQAGVFVVDGDTFTVTNYIPTGIGAHGITPSRDSTKLYVANRGSDQIGGAPRGPGKVSVIDIATNTVVADWVVAGGGSPDMGNLNADGTELWLSGRFDSEVYVFDTVNGVLAARIPVDAGPHGLAVWPQPGRYSLGHTGNMR